MLIRQRQMGMHQPEPNRLLAAIPDEDYETLLDVLVPEIMEVRQSLFEAGSPIAKVYFPRTGVCSMIVSEHPGRPVEVATIGKEGFVGLPLLFQESQATYKVICQVRGEAFVLDAEKFRDFVEYHADTRNVLLRYANFFVEDIAQGSACNKLHSLDQRCARWLLATHDRAESDTFDLTHEFLALMLGVRRAGVTVAMGNMQEAGAITYRRGRVNVVNRERLEEATCACYHVTVQALDRLLTAVGSEPLRK
jgi:CRP-like cAMP-binding protein